MRRALAVQRLAVGRLFFWVATQKDVGAQRLAVQRLDVQRLFAIFKPCLFIILYLYENVMQKF
jgi:hypothetical protein